ncbi:hypothetical protein BCV70DRAFT_82162 [Testicularia cyperi]|uniref:Uncharacterized protein n=1 Tax=Testicularia cyperi TaxID=1882483 RepID=A0A317XHX9_9BASI|nr:hypothetical protein BCV70DRAFT_82162 [Testicularia cyperi]
MILWPGFRADLASRQHLDMHCRGQPQLESLSRDRWLAIMLQDRSESVIGQAGPATRMWASWAAEATAELGVRFGAVWYQQDRRRSARVPVQFFWDHVRAGEQRSELRERLWSRLESTGTAKEQQRTTARHDKSRIFLVRENKQIASDAGTDRRCTAEALWIVHRSAS